MSILTIVNSYIQRGWSPVPVPFKAKAPKGAWSKSRITHETAPEHFKDEQINIGIILGPASGGLTDVDLDCPEAVELAPYFLPPTDAVFGRDSKQRSHYLYRTTLAGKSDKSTERFEDSAVLSDRLLLEVRIGGEHAAQTVFPGSVHTSDEAIKWDSDGEPAEIDGEVLMKQASYLSAAVLILRYWPENRSHLRHKAALVLGGFLARCGQGANAGPLAEVIARSADDEEVEDRRRAASDAAAEYEKGGRAYGLPAMKEIFGEKVGARIAEFMSYARGGPLGEMNAQYAVVNNKGKACVVSFQNDTAGRVEPIFHTFEAFKQLHDNHRISYSKGGGKTAEIGKGSWWLLQRGRRQYDGITFRPGKKGDIVVIDKQINLWTGFGVTPERGDWSLMRDHIHDVLADGDSAHAGYIIKWLAWAVQNPGDRAESVLVFKGEEGSGKGALGNTMASIFGSHGRRIEKHKHLTGNFNFHLQNTSFLFADEAFFPGDKSADGTLKALVTEPLFMIEPKNFNAYEIPNCLHIVMASNNKWTVPAGHNARRYAIFRVSSKRVDDNAYFKALFGQLENGGRAAMLHEFLNMDLGTWHPRDDVPKTRELLDEKINTLDSEEKWWLSVLDNGRLPTYPPLSPNECVSSYLYDDYIAYAGKTSERRKSIEVQLGKFLKKLMPGMRNRVELIREKGDSKRARVLDFESLGQCRKAFDQFLSQEMEWQEPNEWLPREDDGDGAGDPMDADIPF